MKALAYRIEKTTYCCMCAEQLARISGFPHLFFATNKPCRVNEDAICQRCGHWYGSHDAACAAERIRIIVMAESMAANGQKEIEAAAQKVVRIRDHFYLSNRLTDALYKLEEALALPLDPQPAPGLVEAARSAVEYLRVNSTRLWSLGETNWAMSSRDMADTLNAALAECGEWERVEPWVPDPSEWDGCNAVQTIERVWPGAQVWRRKLCSS